MNRNDYLEHFLSLLQLMRYQTTLPANEIDGPFFWRCSGLLCKSMSRAADLGIISHDDYLEVSRIASEIRDQYEYAVSSLFPHGKSLYFSDLFKSVAKDDKGNPLKPVRLCSLLEQKIFKGLPEFTQDKLSAVTIKLFMSTGSNKPVEECIQ